MLSPEETPLQLVVASAGSGKTFQLVHRFISLLSRGIPADTILGSTFSRKAAQEIFERVVLYLLDASEDESMASQIADRIDDQSFTSEKAWKLLSTLLQNQSRLLIGTLDSFTQTLGKLFHERVGLAPHWDIPDMERTKSIEEEALRRVLSMDSSEVQATLLAELLSHDASRTIFSRIHDSLAHLRTLFIEAPYAAWDWSDGELLSLRIPEKTSLLKQLNELEIPLTKKGTPQSRWKKSHAAAVEALENGHWKDFLSKGVSLALGKEDEKFDRVLIPDDWRTVYTQGNALALSQVLSALCRKTTQLKNFLALFAVEYDAIEKERGVHGFDSVKHRLAHALHDVKQIDLAYRLDRKVRHLLLDEFQDTTPTEWSVLQPLVEEIASEPNAEHTMFVVGDPKQAIYGWRGGSAKLFSQISERYAYANVASLSESYRSSAVVMDFINTIFEDLSSLDCFSGHTDSARAWSQGFVPHKSAQSDLPGYIKISTQSSDEEEEGIEVSIANDIKGLLNQNPNLSIAVLVRSNKELLPFVLAFENLDIDVSAEGGSPLTDSPVVIAFLTLFHAMVHPADTRSWFHVQQTPLSLCVMPEQEDALMRFESSATVLQRKILSSGIASFIREYAREFIECSTARDEVRLEQLLELAIEYDLRYDGDLEAFIQLARNTRVEDERPGLVRIMTVHRSKGLEFDAVFLPRIDYSFTKYNERSVLVEKADTAVTPQKIIAYADTSIRHHVPRLARMYESSLSEHLQEELSVFYVALTRAKQANYIYLSPEEQKRKAKLSGEKILRESIPLLQSEWESGDPEWCKSEVVCDVDVKGRSREACQWQGKSVSRSSTRQKFLQIRSCTSSTELSFDETRRGIFFHALLQQICWIEDAEELYQTRAFEKSRLSHDLRHSYFSDFSSQLDGSMIRELLSQKKYAGYSDLKVYTEYPFAYLSNSEIIRGVIDRLVFYQRDDELFADVIDFKTGYQEVEASQLPVIIEAQLGMYKHAILRLFPHVSMVKRIGCFFDRNEIVVLDD